MYLYAITRQTDSKHSSRTGDKSMEKHEQLIAVFTTPYRAHNYINSMSPREDANILVLKPSGIMRWLVKMASCGSTYLAIDPTHFQNRMLHQQTVSIGRLLGDLGRTVVERIRALSTQSLDDTETEEMWHCQSCGKILRRRVSESEAPVCCGHPMQLESSSMSPSVNSESN